MENKYYFTIEVSKKQEQYANDLVEYSLIHHPIPNIWDYNKKDKTKILRHTGTLGEIVFADTYNLPRPLRSFGAIDGQDYGSDFILNNKIFDIKTMQRKTGIFYKNYVLNIPARNIKRKDSKTDYYFCISLHKHSGKTFASFIGYLNKKDILDGKIGILYKKGTKRIRRDGSTFVFYEDTYEVFFKNITSPFINEEIKKLDAFEIKHLR